MATKAKEATETKEVAKKTATKAVKESKVETAVQEAPKAKAASKSKGVSAEQIRQKAYEIFLKTGNHNEHDNWVQAEKELLN